MSISFRLLTLSLVVGALSAQAGGAKAPAPQDENQKALYAFGASFASQLEPYQFTPEEMSYIQSGMIDANTKAPLKLDLKEYGPKVQELLKAKQETILKGEVEKNGALARDYYSKEVMDPATQKGEEGLLIKFLVKGKGTRKPKATDTVKVHYVGTLVSGDVFDSSRARNEPAEFPLDRVIRCWTLGVQQMVVGDRVKLSCPAEIAYGAQGRAPVIGPGALLVFDVELLDIKASPAAKTPAKPAAAKKNS